MLNFILIWGAVVTPILILILVLRRKSDDLKGVDKNLLKLMPTRGSTKRVFGGLGFLYRLFYHMPLLSTLQARLYEIIRRVNLETEDESKEVVVKVILKMFSIYVLVIALAILFADAWHAKLSFLVGGIFLVYSMQMSAINKQVESSRVAQMELLEELKHNYIDTLNVNTCFSRCADSLEGGAAIYATQIRDVLLSQNPEAALEDYYDSAPSPTLQKLAGISRMISVLGEPEEENELVFVNSLDRLHEELWWQQLESTRVKDSLSGKSIMAIVPAFCAEFLANWVSGSFPDLSDFFEGRLGIYCIILSYVTIIIGMVGIVLTSKESGHITDEYSRNGEIARFFLRFKPIKFLLSNYAPDHGRTDRSMKIVHKTEEFLNKNSSKLSIHEFYFNKLASAVCVFVCVALLQFYAYDLGRIVLADLKSFDMVVMTASESLEKMKRNHQAQFISNYANKGYSREQLYDLALKEVEEKGALARGTTPEEYATETVTKVIKFENEVFKWTDLILAFVLALLAYLIPNLFISIKSYLRSLEMSKEVDGFYTVVGILSRMDHMLVQDILDWLERYSSVFKDDLTRARASYGLGAKRALEELKEGVGYKPLERLVDRLLKAVKHLTIKEAFSDINRDRTYMLEARKRDNDMIFNTKVFISNIISWTPLIGVIFFLLLLPFVFFLVDMILGMSDVFDLLGGS